MKSKKPLTMRKIRTGSFEAYLDNLETAQVTYSSEFVRRGFYINTITSCIYKGVEIVAIFSKNGCEDVPYSIWKAVENNAESLWELPVTNLN